MARRVLLAGFEPFGGDKINPSEMVARSFEGRTIAGRIIAVRVIPVETRNIRERFETALKEDNPDIVILLQQFGGRAALSMERVAVNVLDFGDATDNVGVTRKADVVSRGGAASIVEHACVPGTRQMLSGPHSRSAGHGHVVSHATLFAGR